jgi:hypothetical protein
LLREVISGRADVLILLRAKEVKFHKEILLFFDLNSIYSTIPLGINLKLWNIKENNIFLDIGISKEIIFP